MSKNKKIIIIILVGFVGLFAIGILKNLGLPVILSTILMFALFAALRAIWKQK
jgi:uncharacterized membrane protein YccC